MTPFLFRETGPFYVCFINQPTIQKKDHATRPRFYAPGQIDNPAYEAYSYQYPDRYSSIVGGQSNDTLFDPEEIKSRMEFDLPISGVGLFDLENSFVYYEGEDEGVSLAQILGSIDVLAGLNGEGVTIFYHQDGRFVGDPDSDDWKVGLYSPNSNFTLAWESDRKIIYTIFAYKLPAVPEPETWAMLLAGLGIVGAVARRATTLA